MCVFKHKKYITLFRCSGYHLDIGLQGNCFFSSKLTVVFIQPKMTLSLNKKVAIMTWQKLITMPAQKIIGKYEIEYWSIRDGKVWHQDHKLAAADASTFEVFKTNDADDCPFIARDAASIFHAWSRLAKIDRDSFVKSGIYWLDKTQVYFEFETSLKALAGSDAASFKSLGGSYAADKNIAWYYGRRMKNCMQTKSLRALLENDFYASDTEFVYFDGKPLPGANQAHFKLLNSKEFYSSDGKNIYYAERKLPRVDLVTWQHVYRRWSKDKNHVFDMNTIEQGISPDGFDKAAAMNLSNKNQQIVEADMRE